MRVCLDEIRELSVDNVMDFMWVFAAEGHAEIAAVGERGDGCEEIFEGGKSVWCMF